MEFLIREARQEDASAMLALIQELADFENEPNAVKVSEADLLEHGFGAHPLYHCFVATVDDKVVGMALVYFKFSTWNGKALHLEDLIVTEAMRGQGIGEALLAQVVAFGKANKVNRIGWVVLDWNKGAIRFYESKGATIYTNWNIAQLDGKTIATYKLA